MLGSEGGCAEPVDVWSVGCMFGEMLGSQGPLFPGNNYSDQVRRDPRHLRLSMLRILILFIVKGKYFARCLSKILPSCKLVACYTPPTTVQARVAMSSRGQCRTNVYWHRKMLLLLSFAPSTSVCPTGVDESMCRVLDSMERLNLSSMNAPTPLSQTTHPGYGLGNVPSGITKADWTLFMDTNRFAMADQPHAGCRWHARHRK